MKCSNCGTELISGNNICPSCGALNIGFDVSPVQSNVIEETQNTAEQPVDNTIQEQPTVVNETIAQTPVEETIVEETVPVTNYQVDENTTPEVLTLDNENMKKDSLDISSGSTSSNYEEVSTTEVVDESPTINKEIEHIDIRIPDRSNTTNEVVEDIEDIDALSGEIKEVPVNKKSFKIPKLSKKALVNVGIYLSIFVVGILVGKIFLATNYCKTQTVNKKVNTKVSYIADGKNNTTNVSGYTYKIPEAYKYDTNDGGLVVYSSDDTFKIFIKPTNVSYQDYSGAKTSLKATLQENGLTVNDIKEIKHNETKYLIAELVSLNTNRMVLFREADEAFYIEVVFNDNNYNYDVINIIDDILKNANKEVSTSKVEPIKFNDYSSLLEKTAKYNKEMK